MDTIELLVVGLVALWRLVVPLGVIRYPLPAILACGLVLVIFVQGLGFDAGPFELAVA